MYLNVLLPILLLGIAWELNMNTALAQSSLSISSTTEVYAPGKSIHLPGNGVGTWKEISLSRRSNSQSWERDGRSLGATSAASWMVHTTNLQNYSCAVWVLSLPIVWLAANYRTV